MAYSTCGYSPNHATTPTNSPVGAPLSSNCASTSTANKAEQATRLRWFILTAQWTVGGWVEVIWTK